MRALLWMPIHGHDRKRVECTWQSPSEPGSGNPCKPVREGHGQSLESSSACCGQVNKFPLGLLSFPVPYLLSGFTVSQWDHGRCHPPTL